MTITDAVIDVLKSEKKPLTVQAITDLILSRSLYQFNTKDEVAMVRGAIHRRCKGYDRKDSISPALFERLENKTYQLIQ
jgi:hypothetical protein